MLKSCLIVIYGVFPSPWFRNNWTTTTCQASPLTAKKTKLQKPKEPYIHRNVPINIVNKKKNLDFQSIFLFLLLNFIMAATALNIPDVSLNFPAFLLCHSKKDPFSHSTVWSFILSPQTIFKTLIFLSHNQFVVFIKYKSSAKSAKRTQSREREHNIMMKNRERKHTIT